MARLALLIACVACTGASGPMDQGLARALADATQRAKVGDTIDFGQLFAGQWSEMVIFPAYQSNATARDELGYDFDLEGTPLHDQDATQVVVLSTGTASERWFVIQRPEGGLGYWTEPAKLQRANATATFGLDEHGDGVWQFAAAP